MNKRVGLVQLTTNRQGLSLDGAVEHRAVRGYSLCLWHKKTGSCFGINLEMTFVLMYTDKDSH